MRTDLSTLLYLGWKSRESLWWSRPTCFAVKSKHSLVEQTRFHTRAGNVPCGDKGNYDDFILEPSK
jgi:hypothetical protein